MRPYKIRNTWTGKTYSYGKAESAERRAALFMPPSPLFKYVDRYEWIDGEDGKSYPLRSVVEAMVTLCRIWDISKPYLQSSQSVSQ